MTTISQRLAFGFMVALIAMGSGDLLADKILLQNGKTIEGEILNEDGSAVTVETATGRLSIPRAQVQSVKKSDRTENAIRRGDLLYASGKFSEAIKAYQEAVVDRPGEASPKIEKAHKALGASVGAPQPVESIDQTEEMLRVGLANASLSASAGAALKTQLAELLLERSKAASARSDSKRAIALLKEAWQWSPETPGVAITYVRALQRGGMQGENIGQILQPYVRAHPEDAQAAELYVSTIWKADCWEALRILYPNGSSNLVTTQATRDLLPDILLACFNTSPYPKDAPVSRSACYEAYLKLRPNADPAILYQARVEENPEILQNAYDLGDCLERQNRLQQAVRAFEGAAGRDPNFKDVLTRLQRLREKIAEACIADELRAIAKAESVIKAATSLAPADFPGLPDTRELLAPVQPLTLVLSKRPVRGTGATPDQYAQALQAYKAELASSLGPAQKAIGESARLKAAAEAKKQKQMAAAHDQLIQEFVIGGKGVRREVLGFSKSSFTANGQTSSELRIGTIRVWDKSGKLEFHARNILVRNDKLVSGEVLYPAPRF